MNLNSYRINYPNNVYFTAMKKNQFYGIDRACVDKFAPPIEKFNTNDDLQTWAKNKRDEIINSDYPARQKDSSVQRQNMLREWGHYLTQDNQAYTPVMGLMVISALVKNLKPNNDNIPLILNKGVLADTIETVKDLEQCNIEKTYQDKLKAYYFDDNNTGETKTGWVLIPSKKNDSENFEKNVEKLQTLSHKSWCTKSYNAKPYLSEGDFHIYLENGKPKLGIRLSGKKIVEVQGERNNGFVPWQYVDELTIYISENNLRARNIKSKIKYAKKTKIEIEQLKKKFNTEYTSADKLAITLGLKKDYTNPEVLLNEFNFVPKKQQDGTYSILYYKQPDDYTFEDIGINEQNLIDNVSEVRNNADFSSSNIKTFNTLKKVGKDFDITNSKITSLGAVESIGGRLIANNSNLMNLGNLEQVGRNVFLNNSQIVSLGKLKKVQGDLELNNLKLKDFGALEFVGGNLGLEDTSFEYSNINLKRVNGDVHLTKENKSIPNCITKDDLKTVEVRGDFIEVKN